MGLDLVHGADAVGGIVFGVGLAQLDNGAVVLRDFDDGAFAVVDVDGFAVGPEVEPVDDFVALVRVALI